MSFQQILISVAMIGLSYIDLIVLQLTYDQTSFASPVKPEKLIA